MRRFALKMPQDDLAHIGGPATRQNGYSERFKASAEAFRGSLTKIIGGI